MAKNRRRHARVRARGVAAHLRTEHGRTPCQVENVSMGGIFVRTDRLEEVGAEIFVDLVKPGWKRQLTLNARITSRVDAVDGRLSKRMPGMGIQFLRLDDKQHERLEGLLRELGANENDFQVSLPDETEPELRALDLNPADAASEPLDPQPQPLWQQAQMVEREETRANTLVEDIEGALREVGLAPPGPVELSPEPLRGKPSLPPEPPTPPPPLAAPPGRDLTTENARLMLQIRGLVMQLSEAQQQLSQRDLEVERLKEELETIRSALSRAVRNS